LAQILKQEGRTFLKDTPRQAPAIPLGQDRHRQSLSPIEEKLKAKFLYLPIVHANGKAIRFNNPAAFAVNQFQQRALFKLKGHCLPDIVKSR
jgi:hypothetical protein